MSVFASGLYGSSGSAIDSRGNLLQANFSGNNISKIDRRGVAEIFAEGFNGPVGIAIDQDDNLVVCNCASNTLSRVTPEGVVSQFAASELFNCPNGITKASDGNYYVVNFSDPRMLRVTPEGNVTEFATLPGGGNGHVAFTRGHLYATSFQGQRIYRVSLEGDVQLFAGTGLTAAQSEGGVTAMIDAYRAWKTDPGTRAVFTEIEVNAMGYQLMQGGPMQAAIELFKLNAESYPQSFNVYDSLAEAYMRSGQNERAIRFYERSLEINPANQNAVGNVAEDSRVPTVSPSIAT